VVSEEGGSVRSGVAAGAGFKFLVLRKEKQRALAMAAAGRVAVGSTVLAEASGRAPVVIFAGEGGFELIVDMSRLVSGIAG